MKRAALSLLLTLSLLMSLWPAALAAEDSPVRETSVYDEQVHGDTDFREMVYQRPEAAPLLREMNQIRALWEDSANADLVLERLQELSGQIRELASMEALARIRSCQDSADPKWSKEYSQAAEAVKEAWDGFVLLLDDALRSPCGEILAGSIPEEQVRRSLAAGAHSGKLDSLLEREARLEQEYAAAVEAGVSVSYDGGSWTKEEAVGAFAEGSLSGGACIAILEELQASQDQILGDIYLRLAALRREIARTAGRSGYGDYAYAGLYARDYSQREARSFHAAVKACLVPVYQALGAIRQRDTDPHAALMNRDFSGDAALDMIEPCLERMSGELAESLAYMRRYHLYDTQASAAKAGGSFTALFAGSGAPFLYAAPSGSAQDFSEIVREFGRYNQLYWSAGGWPSGGEGEEVSQVYAQGLELLLSHYASDLFGEDGPAWADDLLYRTLEEIVTGAMLDELEQFVYAAGANATVSDINRTCARLCAEYGLTDAGASTDGLRLWQETASLFTDPFSHIGRSVSAAGALVFWLNAQEDFFAAVDQYLAFTALPSGTGLQAGFQALDLPSPTSPAFLERLSAALERQLKLNARQEPVADASPTLYAGVSFTDVRPDSWYGGYVLTLASLGLVEGFDDGSFRPSQSATVDDVYRALLGEDYASEDGGEPITRLYFCQLVALSLGLAVDQPAEFSDTEDPAVALLSSRGVINGYADGTFRPDALLSRAELCACLCRLFSDAIAELAGEAG